MRASGTSRLHFIEVEVYLWQVLLEAFMQDVSINFNWLPWNSKHSCPVHTTPEKFEKDVNHSENTSNVFRPHFATLDLCLRES